MYETFKFIYIYIYVLCMYNNEICIKLLYVYN